MFLGKAQLIQIHITVAKIKTSTHFIDTFRQLKQKILWKWEDENISNLPENVIVRKWMPQSDILAHKNVILFITHGGMFGTMEGIHRGVPMLFLPFFGDQHRNALQATQSGYGLMLHFNSVSSKTLNKRLNALIYNENFRQKAKEISTRFKDNPIDPLANAVYWMEFIVRHKGAKHLKSAAVNQSYFSYMLFDVYFALVLGLFIVMLGVRKVITLKQRAAIRSQKIKEKNI